MPTLVRHGKDDRTVPVKDSVRKTAKLINGAIEKYYPGPHGITATHEECSDPVGIVPPIRQQHCPRRQARQKFACEPVVVCLSGCQRKPNRKAIGIDQRMKLVNPPRERPMDCLLSRVMQAPC